MTILDILNFIVELARAGWSPLAFWIIIVTILFIIFMMFKSLIMCIYSLYLKINEFNVFKTYKIHFNKMDKVISDMAKDVNADQSIIASLIIANNTSMINLLIQDKHLPKINKDMEGVTDERTEETTSTVTEGAN